MKALKCSLALIFVAASAHAGSFGGPPPFTNGSPLPTGVDGSYQANATASNTTGVIRFAYTDNSQTSSTTANSYVFFSEGLTFSGPAAVNITLSTIAGVLQRDTTRAFSNTAMTGSFTAKIGPHTPSYYFKGKGFMQAFIQEPAPSTTFLNFFSKNLKIKGVRTSIVSG
jgi:hypothetical protein